ncbi:hypothetical protein CEV32_4115 [Brucella rhizosphaerae]|uniref:Uncharacterized protein n=1 Tax=Brucella rhizosphaerae TaxID=571254 RepID=A0A256FPW3_9HYPH|nr:hypothetical protein CEV32_4115 [Brucella rhizosphaerae]
MAAERCPIAVPVSSETVLPFGSFWDFDHILGRNLGAYLCWFRLSVF